MANRPKELDPSILTIADLSEAAGKRLPAITRDYFNQGAGDLVTLKDNETAFTRYKLRPLVLKDVDNVDLSTTIFGQKVPFPLGFSPSAAHKLAHPDGEIATSKAAAKNGIPMCLSSWSTVSLEDVVAQSSGNGYAMQVPFLRDVNVTKRIIERAEKAGYKALFVSVDLPVLGARHNEVRNKFTFPTNLNFPILFENGELGLQQTYETGYDPSITWEKTIPWLRANTKMEIWLKGVYTGHDVQKAIDYGLDGILVSNHGGRQLDGVPATLDALRECAPVAKGKIKLALDGGIRSGADIFKALALGADFCFIGRIPIWGLAYNGEDGADLAVKILYEEFRRTMMFMGCKTIEDIRRSHLSVLRPDGILAKL